MVYGDNVWHEFFMPYQRKIQAITIDQHTRRLLWNDFELAFHCQRSKQRYSNC